MAGAVTEVIVGAVISLVTEVVVGEFEDGPFVFVTVPSTEFAINCGIIVPALHEETVSVKLVPDAALMENEHPVAVPELEKSALAMPDTFWLITIEYVIALDELVGDV